MVGEYICIGIIAFHAVTLIADIMVRSCKVKGRFRTLAKFTTVSPFWSRLFLVFELQDTLVDSDVDFHLVSLLAV